MAKLIKATTVSTKVDNNRQLTAWLFWAITTCGIMFAFWKVQEVNYITTYVSLVSLTGVTSFASALALGVVAADVFSLARVFAPATGLSKEAREIKAAGSVWLVVASFDIVLNWYFAAMRIEETQPNIPQSLYPHVWLMPVVIALVIAGAQLSITYLFGVILERFINTSTKAEKPLSTGMRKPKVSAPPPPGSMEDIAIPSMKATPNGSHPIGSKSFTNRR